MFALGGPRGALVAGGTLMLAVGTGLLVAQASDQGLVLVGMVALAAFVVVVFEVPILGYATLALLLGAASEEARDARLLPGSDRIYDSGVSVVTLPIVVLAVLAVALLLTLRHALSIWPGAPATVAASLLMIAAGYATAVGPFEKTLFVARPLFVLFLAIFVGYLLALRYGPDVLLKGLVLAAAVAIPIGLYNVSAGDISYYDSSATFLLGMAVVLVLFRAVDIGIARVPFALLGTLVIVLSLRRGAILAVAVILLVTGIVAGRGTFRAVVGIVAGSVIAAELVAPGAVVSHVEGVANYFTGASGQDFSVNYRKFETTNALLNVEENWLWGIGPSAEWTLYRTFDGEFDPENHQYIHNSYLWVWLRYGLVGLVAYVLFLGVSAFVLIRRSAPVAIVAIGASMIGLAVALVTASFLTTTTRWPLLVGLIVGTGIAARRLHQAEARGVPALAPAGPTSPVRSRLAAGR